jgi:hypothetical protein
MKPLPAGRYEALLILKKNQARGHQEGCQCHGCLRAREILRRTRDGNRG